MTDKVYIAKYESGGNLEKGESVIFARNITVAQDNFFAWLKNQPLYQHMWTLSLEIREIDDAI